MIHNQLGFDEHHVLHHLKHYLPAQNPLKDFVHHNTLHAFQDKDFFEALHESSEIFGYKTYLSIKEFRDKYASKEINHDVLHAIIVKRKGADKIVLVVAHYEATANEVALKESGIDKVYTTNSIVDEGNGFVKVFRIDP